MCNSSSDGVSCGGNAGRSDHALNRDETMFLLSSVPQSMSSGLDRTSGRVPTLQSFVEEITEERQASGVDSGEAATKELLKRNGGTSIGTAGISPDEA